MTVLVSLAVFVACVTLLNNGVSVRDVTIIFATGKVLGVFFLGGGFGVALVVALVVSVLAFGYFWLLDRVAGSWLWWLVLLGGVLLLA